MSTATRTRLSEELREAIRPYPLTGAPDDYDKLLAFVGDAGVVLLGEASHGTHEFYRERAHSTRRLIEERGFTVVAVEADWPDAYRVNRYVRGGARDGSSNEALGDFKRFPTWMWRNAEVLDFIGWLRAHNDRIAEGDRSGFYGLDLYSLHRSIEGVLRYLDRVDPEAAKRARNRYACFDHYGENSQAYGYAAEFGLSKSCEDEVVDQLVDLVRHAEEYTQPDGSRTDEFFFAEQNARLVRNAEQYYRTMFRGRMSSWNLRDQHMAETLEALVSQFERQGRAPKVVVWAHNSHLGDARATDMGDAGELNVGQLVRERYGQEAVSIGFSTYEGTVTAASDWDGPAERKRVRPALPGSFEALFHDVGGQNFWLPLRPPERSSEILATRRLERAIGVIYLPESERLSHYFYTQLPKQFDAILHFDATRAVEPLERTPQWQRGGVAETFPSGV